MPNPSLPERADGFNPSRTPGTRLMRSANAIQATVVIVGLCASLTLSLAACSSMAPEGSSEPAGEEMFGGDDRDMAPAHQEKMREGGER
jgi:hypothetical protein